VAVVINNTEILKRFNSSIRQYTNVPYELILLDNASDDPDAIRTIRDLADVHHRFEERMSLATAWNRGISMSRGKFIAVANDDTVVSPNWFLPLKETLVKNKSAGMVTPMTLYHLKLYFQYGNMAGFNGNFEKPLRLERFKDMVVGEFCVFKRRALLDVDGYCELYKGTSSEDIDMDFKLYSKGYEIYMDPRVFVHHQLGSSSEHGPSRDIKNKNRLILRSRWPEHVDDVLRRFGIEGFFD